MSQQALIVDPDTAFAAMLAQSLEEMMGLRATTVSTGQEALEALSTDQYRLAVVDMDLPDMTGADLVRAVKRQAPDLAVMVIPLEGEQIPPELDGVEVDGILPKPFFLPELPERVGRALGQAAPPTPTSAIPPADQDAARREMSLLAQELGAKAVVLTRGDQLLDAVGDLSLEEAETLATAVAESWQTSARVAKMLGKEQLRFEQSIEGGEHLLYSLAIVEDLTLSALIERRVPLGMIRHRAKEAAEAIRRLVER